jgi:hypothetical protein
MSRSAASILGLSIIISFTVIGLFWRSNYSMNQTITVTGSAKIPITSNFASLGFELESQETTAAKAYQELQKQIPFVLEYLKKNGISDEQIKRFPVTNWDIKEYTNSGNMTGRTLYWRYGQRFEIESFDVYKIQSLSNDLAALVTQGVTIRINPPQFLFTDLDEIKIKIQAAAAENATLRARNIAEATGRKLGALSGARMGVLQITPVNSNEVSGYGINDVTSIEKEVTGVVQATFRIE